MSTSDLEQALDIIEGDADRAEFAGPIDEDVVAAAEKALGLKFPSTYRRFLLRLGAGNYGAAEFYGIVDEDLEGEGVPNGIWLTLDERSKSKLPPDKVVVAATGDGDYYCLDVRGPGEAKVVIFAPGAKSQTWPVDAEDFGAFLLERVSAEQESE